MVDKFKKEGPARYTEDVGWLGGSHSMAGWKRQANRALLDEKQISQDKFEGKHRWQERQTGEASQGTW